MKYEHSIKTIQFIFAVTIISLCLFNIVISSEKYPTNRIFLGNSKSNAVSGKYLFVSAGGTILVGEIISADSVHYVSEIALPSIVTDMKAQGNYLYVSDLINGLFIIDCSNIVSPTIVGKYKSTYRAYGIFVNGNDVYIGWGKDGISKINVTIKQTPTLLKYSSIQSGKIHLYHGNLYCQTSNKLTVLNSTSLDSITTIPTGVSYPYYEIKNVVYSDFNVAVIENYYGIKTTASPQYNPSTNWGTISFYNVANINSPILNKVFLIKAVQSAEANGNILHCLTSDSLIRYKIFENEYLDQVPVQLAKRVNSMTMNDSLLFMSTDYPGYFQIARYFNQNNIVTNYFLDTKADIGSVAATDSFLVAGTESYGGLYLVELNPNNKSKIKQKYNDSIGYVRGVKIVNDTVYVASEKGLKIFFVKNDSLIFIGGLDYGNVSWCIDKQNNIVAIGGYYYDVHLIDVSDINNLKYLKKIDIPNGSVVEDIHIQDSILYITGRYTGVYAYNIKNPILPELLWWMNLYNSETLYPSGKYLFVGDGYYLRVFDITKVNSPFQIDSVALPDNKRCIKIISRDSLVFVTFFSNGYSENNGLLAYGIADNGKLSLISFAYTPDWPNNLALNTQSIFVSDNLDGVYVYNISSLITSVTRPYSQTLPKTFSLYQNYPNPFNPTTIIEFSLSKNSRVILNIYDVLGREITTLINEEMKSGNHKTTFNAAKISSGVYYYQLNVDGYSLNKKMLFIK